MKTHLDHIAIAVKDIEKSVKTFETLGLKFSAQREVVESQGVKTAFAPIDQHAHLELLEPISSGSTIQKFLDQKGEGIHHFCMRVEDIYQTQKELEEQGMKLIYEKPFLGAGNCMVNFIHPKTAHGCLIEISQKMED